MHGRPYLDPVHDAISDAMRATALATADAQGDDLARLLAVARYLTAAAQVLMPVASPPAHAPGEQRRDTVPQPLAQAAGRGVAPGK